MTSDQDSEGSQYKNFWDFFSSNLSFLETCRESPYMVTDAVSKMLDSVAPNVDFEMGQHPDGYFELILIAGGIAENIDTVIGLYNAAPPMENWVVTPFRPRQTGSTVNVNGTIYDPEHIFYRSAVDEYGYTCIEVYIEGFTKAREEELGGLGFMMLDIVLGEFDVMTRLGAITFDALPPNHAAVPDIKSLTELAAEVDARYPYDA